MYKLNTMALMQMHCPFQHLKVYYNKRNETFRKKVYTTQSSLTSLRSKKNIINM